MSKTSNPRNSIVACLKCWEACQYILGENAVRPSGKSFESTFIITFWGTFEASWNAATICTQRKGRLIASLQPLLLSTVTGAYVSHPSGSPMAKEVPSADRVNVSGLLSSARTRQTRWASVICAMIISRRRTKARQQLHQLLELTQSYQNPRSARAACDRKAISVGAESSSSSGVCQQVSSETQEPWGPQ